MPDDMKPRRDWLFLGCERGHTWVSIGGCNAGCADSCCCSVPVLECSVCGDCDYGQSEEADQVRADCHERLGTPEEWAETADK